MKVNERKFDSFCLTLEAYFMSYHLFQCKVRFEGNFKKTKNRNNLGRNDFIFLVIQFIQKKLYF